MIGHIIPRMPPKIETYYEPFLGGGAVFFELARQKRFARAVIGDCNEELINTYRVIKNNVDELIKELQTGDFKYAKANYLRVRAIAPKDLSNLERAARFIFLNRTCFNGLYRVNSKTGAFNVPFGKYKNPVICDEPNLRAISDALKNVEVMRTDFLSIVDGAKEGDAVYFDPPYVPTSKTSKFTSYTMRGFDEADHRRLAECFDKLSGQGVCCVLSNSFAPLVIELYDKYGMTKLMGARSIGGPASYRKPAEEIVVSAGWTSPEEPDVLDVDVEKHLHCLETGEGELWPPSPRT
jgi:DNA adenine methylase